MKHCNECPFCGPREDKNEYWERVATLTISSLYLHKIQTYRGYSILIFDPRHVTRPSDLSSDEWQAFCSDLYLAQSAIEFVVKPDLMNTAALGNQIEHLHWHIIPRYESDPRWGAPIWTTKQEEMEVLKLSCIEHEMLASRIRDKLTIQACSRTMRPP